MKLRMARHAFGDVRVFCFERGIWIAEGALRSLKSVVGPAVMYYVYRIQSLEHVGRSYTGFTEGLKQRIKDHNKGSNTSTAPFRPWKLVFYAAFEARQVALDFERHLKTGSGKAFAGKRFWPE